VLEGRQQTAACVACAVSGIVAGSNKRWFVREGHEKAATYKIKVAFGGVR
jgi:hypothetical protein